jgi:hypothetical protein
MSEKNDRQRRSPMIITPFHYTDISGKLTPRSRHKNEIENIVKTHVKNLIMEINDVLEICAQSNQTHHIFETQAVLREALIKLSTIYI